MKLHLHLVLALFPFLVTATETEVAPIQREILIQSEKSWDGELLPAYPDEQPQISVVKFTVAPGAKLPEHKHPMINAGFLINGELVIHAEDGSKKHLKAGEGIIEVVKTWHYGESVGDVPAEIVVVYAGVKGQPLAILKEPPSDS